MREILFRSQRIDNGEWVEGDLICASEGKAYIVQDCATECYDGEGTDLFAISWYEVVTETVGQYTGLLDKNGKRIFEGDIVRCVELRSDEITEYTSPVFWDDCTFLVRESVKCDCCLCVFDGNPDRRPLTEIEVIGNIHDTPWLLVGTE